MAANSMLVICTRSLTKPTWNSIADARMLPAVADASPDSTMLGAHVAGEPGAHEHGQVERSGDPRQGLRSGHRLTLLGSTRPDWGHATGVTVDLVVHDKATSASISHAPPPVPRATHQAIPVTAAVPAARGEGPPAVRPSGRGWLPAGLGGTMVRRGSTLATIIRPTSPVSFPPSAACPRSRLLAVTLMVHLRTRR